MTKDVQKVALNIGEAANSIGISRAILYSLLKTNRGPKTIKLGRRRMITKIAVNEWLQNLEQGGKQ